MDKKRRNLLKHNLLVVAGLGLMGVASKSMAAPAQPVRKPAGTTGKPTVPPAAPSRPPVRKPN